MTFHFKFPLNISAESNLRKVAACVRAPLKFRVTSSSPGIGEAVLISLFSLPLKIGPLFVIKTNMMKISDML